MKNGKLVNRLKVVAISICAMVLFAAAPLKALAQGYGLRFNGAIGVQPLTALGLNTVLGIEPDAYPWVIKGLQGTVSADGRVSVEVDGLLPAGGGDIGIPGPASEFEVTLFCDGAFVFLGGSGVPLSNDMSSFTINTTLGERLPSNCSAPTLLIVTDFPCGSGDCPAWYAAGIPVADSPGLSSAF